MWLLENRIYTLIINRNVACFPCRHHDGSGCVDGWAGRLEGVFAGSSVGVVLAYSPDSNGSEGNSCCSFPGGNSSGSRDMGNSSGAIAWGNPGGEDSRAEDSKAEEPKTEGPEAEYPEVEGIPY